MPETDDISRRLPWYGRPTFVKAVGVAVATVVVAFGGWTFFGGKAPTTPTPTTPAPATATPTAAPTAAPVTSKPLPPMPVMPFDFNAYGGVTELCHALAGRWLHGHQCPCPDEDVDLETMYPGDCAEFEEYLR